jgi:DNA-directed RNA polymerase subunit M/transcription elongation factor TFIIS
MQRGYVLPSLIRDELGALYAVVEYTSILEESYTSFSEVFDTRCQCDFTCPACGGIVMQFGRVTGSSGLTSYKYCQQCHAVYLTYRATCIVDGAELETEMLICPECGTIWREETLIRAYQNGDFLLGKNDL